MKKLLIALGILALAIPAYGRTLDLWIGDGTGVPDSYDQDTGDSYFEACMEIDGDLNLDGYLWLRDGTAALPAMFFDSEVNDDSGFYYIADDSYGASVAGVVNTIWDANGVTVIGLDGPIGAIAPDTGAFTTVDGTNATFTGFINGGGDFNYGPDAGDLHTGYRRTETIKTIDGFDHGSDAHLAVIWDIATLSVGAGVNNVTTTDGWNRFTTAAAGADSEGTQSNGLHHYRAYEPRLEIVVDLGTVAVGQNFYFGFWAGANDYAQIINEPATSLNWLLRVDNGGAVVDVDSGVLATTDPTKLEIWTDAAGLVDWAIDDVDYPASGTALSANAQYCRYYLLNVAAGAKTTDVDYIIQEQNKMQP